ncbi:MAG: peptidoglycan D,D-transpeptidase FtsI family protein [Planctomycetota bacterium]|jgi:cell division protein FtsI (penicillin-binding protein 3)
MKLIVQRMWVSRALIGLVCLVFLLLIGRLAYIHTKLSPRLTEWSRSRQCTEIELPGRRGSILDRKFRVLAGTHNRPTIFADPRLIADQAEAAERLSVVLGMPADSIEQLLNRPTSPGYVIIRRAAEQVEAEAVESLGIEGLGVGATPARVYPMGSLSAHILGFVNMDSVGLEGIELAWDKYLRPKSGKRVVFRDIRRRAMFQEEDSYVPATDGMHVILTIDAAIQEILERELAERVEHHAAESGVGLVMNPQTGEVLAMACVPTFEPARGGEFESEVRRNRILTDPVEPGSIFKPYIMAAALAEGLTKPDEVIFCENGLYVVGKRRLHDHHAYGNLTTEMIMVKSSNIGMAKLGQRLGNKKMYQALRTFGYGQLTGIGLPGEGEGLLMPLSRWYSYTTTSVPMGQELAVTPIQIATAFSVLVNGGWLVKPRLVRAVVDYRGQVVEDFGEPEIIRQALDPSTASTMRDILLKVVNEGTGRPCRLDEWQVLGKTGTAQVPWKHRRGYEPGAYLSSFIAAAPARDAKLVVLVMVRKPRRNGYYGSQVAAPGVKAILSAALSYMDIPADKPAKELIDKRRLARRGRR